MKQVYRMSQTEVFQILLQHVATNLGYDLNDPSLRGDVNFDINAWSKKIDHVDVSVYRIGK
jgi:hypothetical protein